MDSPVTDILFVSSQENCPEGYTLVSECPCGHSAQLWEKVLGGKEGERYICFTKAEKDGLVVEDMYIPKRSAQWVYKGYKIIKHTAEGDEPMRHRQLAVKKVPKSEAKMVIADIIVCRGRDTVSKLYRRLEKINGVCICFRRVEYKPQLEAQRRSSDPLVKQLREAERGRATTMNNDASKLAKNLEGLAMRDRRSGSDSSNGYYSPSPPPDSSPYSTSPVEHRSSPYSTSPVEPRFFPPRVTTDSSDGRPRPVEEVATVSIADTLSSAPPPSHPTNGSYYQPPSSTASGPYPAPPTRDPTYPTAAGGYPPYKLTPVEQSPQSFYLSYPPSQPHTITQPSGPPPPSQAGYDTRIGFAVGGGNYPPPQPPAGYASVAGPSFMGTAFATQQPGPAPYNPFHHQQGPTPYPLPPASSAPYPPPPSSSAPYPPPPSSSAPYPPPPSSSAPYPPSTTSSQNYGFNF